MTALKESLYSSGPHRFGLWLVGLDLSPEPVPRADDRKEPDEKGAQHDNTNGHTSIVERFSRHRVARWQHKCHLHACSMPPQNLSALANNAEVVRNGTDSF